MTLNIENFDKLYGYVDALPDDDAPGEWALADCFGGIVKFKLRLDDPYICTSKLLAHFLGIDEAQGDDLFLMYSNHREDRGGRFSFMTDYAMLSRPKQKVVMLDVLRTLRQEGRVAWDKAFTLVTDGAV